MSQKIEFETPENIGVSYQTAGLGTRFVAWVIDSIILTIAAFVILIVLLIVGVFSDQALRELGEPFSKVEPGQPPQFSMYFIGVATLINGLLSLMYFGLSELFLRGQTIGKRKVGVRVVRLDGFSLDAGSILVRNVFRLIDNLPMLWIVPVLSKRSQRSGDMIAGTIVVNDRPDKLGDLREGLAERPAVEAQFRFDALTLKRLRPQDVEAVERILDRWETLKPADRTALLDRILPPLTVRLQVEAPTLEERRRFLEELLAAELRRQHRNLG